MGTERFDSSVHKIYLKRRQILKKRLQKSESRIENLVFILNKPIADLEVDEWPQEGFFGSHFFILHRNSKFLKNLESSSNSTFILTHFVKK